MVLHVCIKTEKRSTTSVIWSTFRICIKLSSLIGTRHLNLPDFLQQAPWIIPWEIKERFWITSCLTMLNWGREHSWTCAFIWIRTRSFEWPGVESLYRPCGAFWFAEVVSRTSTHHPEMPGDIIRWTNNIREVIIKKNKTWAIKAGSFISSTSIHL